MAGTIAVIALGALWLALASKLPNARLEFGAVAAWAALVVTGAAGLISAFAYGARGLMSRALGQADTGCGHDHFAHDHHDAAECTAEHPLSEKHIAVQPGA
jgi:hypothetical protein